jgi:hypothetical protein
MTIAFEDRLTSAGDRYWRIVDSVTSQSFTPPIWTAEIGWFVQSLERIAATLNPVDYPEDERAYPIEYLFRGIDAVVILFDRKYGVPRLRFERWKGTWVNEETDATHLRRYFGPNGKSAFGQLRLIDEWQDEIRALATHFYAAAKDDGNRYWSKFYEERKDVPATPPSPELVIVRAPPVMGR